MNRYGKISELRLEVCRGKTRSQIKNAGFTAPFKITSPFYDEYNNMQIMVMSISAGIMDGDTQNIDISIAENARAEILSQSFEKIHRMGEDGLATRSTKLTVSSGATLIYSPLPTIPFAGSAFVSSTKVILEDETSGLLLSEILSCGRAARDEYFMYRLYKARTDIYQNKKLIYLDNSIFEPVCMHMKGYCLFEGYTHLANILLMNLHINEEVLCDIRKQLESLPCEAGVSKTGSGGLCIRALANRAEILLDLEQRIKNLIR